MLYSTITLWLLVLLNCEPGSLLHAKACLTRMRNYQKLIDSVELDSVTCSRDSFHRLRINRVVSRLQIQSTCPPDGLANLLHDRNELDELSLICVPLSNADIQAMATLNKLRRLDLRGCRLTHEQLHSLSRCPVLEELDLRGTSLKPDEIVAFRQRYAKLLVVHTDR